MIEETLIRVNEYKERATRYLINFEAEREMGDREKSGEALWGVVSCLINALFLLENGRPSSSHGVSCEYAKQFIISTFGEKEGWELFSTYRKVEKFHANFYHAFLDEDEFEAMTGEILRLIERLSTALDTKLGEIKF